MSSYYVDLDDDLGSWEEGYRDARDYEFEQNRVKANRKTSIRKEVRKQLKLLGVENKKPVRGNVQDVKCANCGSEFKARVADIKRGWGKFCSKSCKASKQRYNGYLHR